MYLAPFTLLMLCLPASAWLPGEHKTIVSRDGTNLFNSTPGYYRGGSKVKRRVPASGKLRGVNLGSLFVFEPWLARTVWSHMGCNDYLSEFGCVLALGHDKANAAFQAHWDAFIQPEDFSLMVKYGLNAVRIPIGYWMQESIVYGSEYFPQGGLKYLERICGWASDAGLYIIIDMHGAPGAQTSRNSDTGQYVSTAGFYADFQYDRGIKFLSWLTNETHTNTNFRNVGMVGILNEPSPYSNTTETMNTRFYPSAYEAIRSKESKLGVSRNNTLHVQMMDPRWGAGIMSGNITDTYFTAYDDHRYFAYEDIELSQASFLSASCNADFSNGNIPTVVGEFSLAVPHNATGPMWDRFAQHKFYAKWFAAQITSYEKDSLGWFFWTWKTQLQDYRWSYPEAVKAGIIPLDLDSVYELNACKGSWSNYTVFRRDWN